MTRNRWQGITQPGKRSDTAGQAPFVVPKPRKPAKTVFAEHAPCDGYLASSIMIDGPANQPYCYNCGWAFGRHSKKAQRAYS